LPAFAQSEDPGRHESAVQAFGSLVMHTTKDGVENKATNSGGVLAPAASSSVSITAWKGTMAMREIP
jgi:hypothetical protein